MYKIFTCNSFSIYAIKSRKETPNLSISRGIFTKNKLVSLKPLFLSQNYKNMTTFQTTHFQTQLPIQWTAQSLSDNAYIWQREEESWIMRIQCEDLGEMSGDKLQAYITSVFTQIELTDGSILRPVGDAIELTDGLLYEYRKESEIVRLDEQTFLANYGGMRLNPNSGRMLTFFVQFFFQEAEIPNLEGYMEQMVNIMENITFTDTSPQIATDTTTQQLKNTRLHFMESYNSGQGGGGYSTEEIIVLHGNQRFSYKYTHVTSAYTSGGISLGGGYKDKKGEGTWAVHAHTGALVLSFSDGTITEYDLHMSQGVIWMNNRKFFWERLDL